MRKYKIGCHVKKRRNQSEMRIIPIYNLSQSGMELIDLLKIREVMSSERNKAKTNEGYKFR